MSIVMQINPFDFFTNTHGDALDAGYIYIGEVNKDPRQYPVVAYYDEALTIPAAMPLRTSNGYIVRNGSPTFLFISGNYSVRVEDSRHRQVYYVSDFLMIGSQSAITPGDLANFTDPSKGAGMVGWQYLNAYADHTVGNAINQVIKRGIPAQVLGIVGDGIVDDSARMEYALSLGKPIDVTGLTPRITREIPCPAGVNLTCTDGSSFIKGYNGLGFRVTAGRISLVGVGFDGFGDGTESNKTNYAAGAIRINTGATIDSLVMNGVRAQLCRTIVTAGSEANDFIPDTTITVKEVNVQNCEIKSTPMPVNLRCKVFLDICMNNNYEDIIGAGRIVCAHKVFVDGVAFNDPVYQDTCNHIVTGNRFKTIVNRTTTGDSTTGNNYETHFVMLSGTRCVVTGNVGQDCTGNIFDAEGIYQKCQHYEISGNILIDCGSTEGAINLKGLPGDFSGVATSPVGDRGKCNDNLIIYTRDSYNNNGTLINLVTVGINTTAPRFVDIDRNFIFGANTTDILIQGEEGSTNEACHVTNNVSYRFGGTASILWRGAFRDPQSNNNSVIDPLCTGAAFWHTRFLAVAARGLSHTNTEFKGNTLRANVSDGRFDGKNMSFVEFDTEIYTFGAVIVDGGQFDLITGSATPVLRPISINRQTAAPAGSIDNLIVRDVNFVNNINSPPIFFNANTKVTEHDIEITTKCTAVALSTITPVQVASFTGSTVAMTLDATINQGGGLQGWFIRRGFFINAAGTATIQGTINDDYVNSNLVAGNITISPNTDKVRVQFTGPGTAKVKMKSVSVAV